MSDLTNLWEETMESLAENGLTWDDVKTVCGDDFIIPKENFEELAKEANYRAGFGISEVARDLKLIGSTWWAVRDEYDGSEWWRFNMKPDVRDLPTVKIRRLYAKRGEEDFYQFANSTLADMNESVEKVDYVEF